MALVVLLRGVNVGGHRTFRPTTLAQQLRHLDAVNIGAAGTFVIRKPVTQSRLRAEVARRLPFDADVVIFRGQELASLLAQDYFTDDPVQPDIIRFVSVLAGRPRLTPSLPMSCPDSGKWVMKILSRKGRFLVGEYRRQMRAISYIGTLDRLFGVPATTRNWNTMTAVSKVLGDGRLRSA
ncbi:MAG TPA: DUF1697 domain-containing protein [Thermoanaerobaculia bacterium]|nr:DUF1697 domain-containing protein [Thermoanaerobaculia bacterium]